MLGGGSLPSGPAPGAAGLGGGTGGHGDRLAPMVSSPWALRTVPTPWPHGWHFLGLCAWRGHVTASDQQALGGTGCGTSRLSIQFPEQDTLGPACPQEAAWAACLVWPEPGADRMAAQRTGPTPPFIQRQHRLPGSPWPIQEPGATVVHSSAVGCRNLGGWVCRNPKPAT